MQIKRKFTEAGTDVFSTVEWATRSTKISNMDGSVVFEMNDAEIPKASWSPGRFADIMVSKYFRKAGVPQYDGGPNGNQLLGNYDDGNPVTYGPERSAKSGLRSTRRNLEALGREPRATSTLY